MSEEERAVVLAAERWEAMRAKGEKATRRGAAEVEQQLAAAVARWKQAKA